MCIIIILQNVKRSPNPHLCSNFQENKRFKTYACNCLITSLEQFIVMCYQQSAQGELLWPAFVRRVVCVVRKLFYLTNFSFETTHWILTKLYRNDP